MSTRADDSLMSRFDQHGLRRFSAREAIFAVALAALALVLMSGGSVRRAGEQMTPGLGRTLVLAAGEPADWIADRLPFDDAARRATAWLSPDERLSARDGFRAAVPQAGGRIPPVTPDAFESLGGRAPSRKRLRTLLVTGDSMVTPLDEELARRLAPAGVRVIRDPHLGTGISKGFVVDWGQLSASQVRRHRPDAVVVFIGANEGFPMPGPGGGELRCCGPEWAAVYANRARRLAEAYRQRGAAHVYWITLPAARDRDRLPISHAVNAAIEVAAQPWRAQVHVIDTARVFTPSGYRDAMPVGGRQTIVRAPDGIHLNEAGSKLLADMVLGQIGRRHTYQEG